MYEKIVVLFRDEYDLDLVIIEIFKSYLYCYVKVIFIFFENIKMLNIF